jgi:hypothetical protein
MSKVLPFTPPVIEVTEEKAFSAAMTLQAMIASGHPESEALRLGLTSLSTQVRFTQLLSERGMSVAILRRIFGIKTPPEEQKPKPSNGGKKGGGKGCTKPKGHGKRAAGKFTQAWHRFFAHPDFNEPGCLCEECHKGGVYPHFGQWHRFIGQAMLKVAIINYEIWRCTLCGFSSPAPIAQDILDDGKDHQTFGYSAIAWIVLAKYFYGTPWARQERMQNMLELPVNASSLHDQTHGFAELITPIRDCLVRTAADAWLFYSDDTGVKIVGLKSETKKQRTTGKDTVRTGVHTSVIEAVLENNTKIAIFKSGIIHAGEFLDEILVNRTSGLPPPLQMGDGSACNPATVRVTIQCHCNAHSRRKLEDKAELYPDHWEVVKKIYREVYINDAETKKQDMSLIERLEYHRTNSKSKMTEMFDWMQKELDDKNVEPNSQLGGVFEYFLTRRNSLMAFTEYPGAPIDNNTVEQLIKFVALIRKNSNYYRTTVGSGDSDKILTVGVTAGLYGSNLYVYFTQIQKYPEEVKANPESFLPWNVETTLKRLEATKKESKQPQDLVRELSQNQWQDRQETIRIQRSGRKKLQKASISSIGKENNKKIPTSHQGSSA